MVKYKAVEGRGVQRGGTSYGNALWQHDGGRYVYYCEKDTCAQCWSPHLALHLQELQQITSLCTRIFSDPHDERYQL